MAPSKAAKGGAGKKKKSNNSKKHIQSYSTYIYKLLKLEQPDLSISKQAMSIMNSFVKDMFERIASEAGKFTALKKRKTLTDREITWAVRFTLNGQLIHQALSDAQRAYMRVEAANGYWVKFYVDMEKERIKRAMERGELVMAPGEYADMERECIKRAMERGSVVDKLHIK